jgi:hypothetical protein
MVLWRLIDIMTIRLIVFAALYVSLSFALETTPPNVIMGTGNSVGYGELKEEWRGEM